MWLYPRPDRDQLYDVYGTMGYYTNTDFYQKDGSKIYGYVDYLAERINKQYRYRKIVADIKKRLARDRAGHPSESAPAWLDVGCGLGFLLDVAFDEGFQVSGVEFSRAAVEFIHAKYTFPVHYGLMSEVSFSRTFDVISLFDVIEHVMDPVSDLKKLRELVAPGGYLVLQTMDSRSLMSRLLGKKLEDFRRTREHLYFFSKKSMTAVLEHCGWDVCDMRLVGQTFQLGALIDRLAVYSRPLSRLIKSAVVPRWLLEANLYVNPGTKMMVVARPK
jgi:2-polyprenyl-3-methyl-5-hydroxy-6-metoxy-1,4-benzoquinol methylase